MLKISFELQCVRQVAVPLSYVYFWLLLAAIGKGAWNKGGTDVQDIEARQGRKRSDRGQIWWFSCCHRDRQNELNQILLYLNFPHLMLLITLWKNACLEIIFYLYVIMYPFDVFFAIVVHFNGEEMYHKHTFGQN